ncbi:MAG: hypothetical protein PQJ60_09155 [Spirochaetales bacterium]|nr:hypothetical protein [Spirochaetales bacterium]
MSKLKRKASRKLHILLFLLLSCPLFGEITVEINMPELEEGMAEIEAMLTANITIAAEEIETTVNDLLDKPELTEAFSTAAGMSSSASLQGNGLHPAEYTVIAGAALSLYSETFYPDELVELFEEMDEESDFLFGVNAHLVHGGLTLPVNRILPGARLALSAAYADLSGEDRFYSNIFLQSALGYAPFDKAKLNPSLQWLPLFAQCAASYSSSEVGMSLETGVITEEFEVDPDDGGPLVGQDVTVQLDPTVDLSLQTQIYVLTADLSTAFTLHDFFHIYGGAGFNWSFGGTDIYASTDEDIEVLGYLSDLIVEEGSLSISGSVDGSAPVEFLPYIYGGFQADISTMFLRFPLQYSYDKGISSGLFMGINL